MYIKKCLFLISLIHFASSCSENGTKLTLTTSLNDTRILSQEVIEYCEGNTLTLTCKFNMEDNKGFEIYSYLLFRCADNTCSDYYPIIMSIKPNNVDLTLEMVNFFDNKIFGCGIVDNSGYPTRIKGSKVYLFKLYKPTTASSTTSTTTTSTTTTIGYSGSINDECYKRKVKRQLNWSRTSSLTPKALGLDLTQIGSVVYIDEINFVEQYFANLQKALSQPEEPEFRLDYTYFSELNGFLKFHNTPLTWFDAKRLCFYEGATLVSPNTTALTMTLTSMLESNEKNEIFTGFNSLNSKGNFYTVEGTNLMSIPYTWTTGEPNDVDGMENCLKLNAQGTLSDVRCDSRKSFVCYRLYKGETLNECDTVDNDYKLYSETNKCYKFHFESKIWSLAHQICAAENAHLVVINSAVESDVIRRIYEQHPSGSIKISEPQWESVAFVGFRYDNNTARYETLEGLSLADSGFEQFQPDNSNSTIPKDLCGGVHRTGMLNVTDCQQDHAFICEKTPKCTMCG